MRMTVRNVQRFPRLRRSTWATVVSAALVGSVIVVPPNSPAAEAGTIVPMACPTGSVEVAYGYAPPAGLNVTPQVGGLLCQSAFTADGTFTTPAGVTSVDVLVVGAGGGGGAGGVVGTQVLAGGGGAGGQVAVFEGVPVTGDISVTVGTGGAGGLDACSPSCSTTGGVDGTDGEGSEFGTGGTYAAGGGEGGAGGATLVASPFMTSGAGGSSPSAPLVSVVPVGVTATVSDGGAGGTAAGQRMGPAQNYYSGAGGGAGAGGAATDASVSGCITADGATSCSVSGGDGGVGVVPYGGYFDYSFWNDWFPFWSFDAVGTYGFPLGEGFGPGGGGGTAGLLLFRTGGGILEYGFGTGRNLDLSEPNASGQGTAAFGFGTEGSTDPYQIPYYVNASDARWSDNAYAFGGGGGGAVGNTSATVISSPDSGDGSPGVNGLVIVLFSPPVDNDGDGYADDVDCDDSIPTVNPGATELIGNGLDDDCDPTTPGFTDESYECTSPAVAPLAVENNYQQLIFAGRSDRGIDAAIGYNTRYRQVGAVGGPTFPTGTITAVTADSVSGAAPWTVTVDVSDTSGLTVGDAVTAFKTTGQLGVGGAYTISNIVDGDTFEVTVTDVSSAVPTTGTISAIRTGKRIDARVTLVDKYDTTMVYVDESWSDATKNARIDVETDPTGESTGTVENISGTGPWTAEVTGLISTAGLTAGTRIHADNDTGSLGEHGVYVVTDVLSSTSIRYSATGGTAPASGSISDFSTWSGVELRIDFLDGATDDLIVVDDVAISIRDIDLMQFAEFVRPNGMRFEADSRLELLTSAELDAVPSNSLRVWSARDSQSTDQRHWIEVRYDSTNSITLRLGQLESDGANYNLNFATDLFNAPVECAINLPDTTPTTTTYTGDTGTFDPGDSLTLSATVNPDTCTMPAVTYELTYPDATTAVVTSPLDTTGFASGTYTITADYAGDGTCEASSDSAQFVLRAQSTTTFTGDTGVVLAGTPVTLSATVGPAECSGMAVTYQIVYPDGTVYDVSSPLSTTGFVSGIYEIIASTDPEDDTCMPSEDRAVLVVTSSADTVTGGGIYHVDSGISGTPRVHFGFTVQKTDKLDRRTGIRTITQRGQLLWINNNQWRLKASLYAQWTDSGGVISGDRPVFGTVPCPAGVGTSGSNPKCGVIAGSGWLERWNSDTLTWDRATDLGDAGWVRFGATIYDGGSVRVCKGKTCSIVDVADWFGMTMTGITASDDGVPVGSPVTVRKQRNGAIVIRS